LPVSSFFDSQDEATILSCLEIYRRWIFEANQKPKPILEDSEQHFVKV
jgi:hypothetical protein